jgi:hypothetical protein
MVPTRGNLSTSFRLRPGTSTYTLTEQEAFLAMELFINQFASTMPPVDDAAFVTLMADIQVEADGITTDPAAWGDWLACVRAVKGEPSIEGTDTWRRMGPPLIVD